MQTDSKFAIWFSFLLIFILMEKRLIKLEELIIFILIQCFMRIKRAVCLYIDFLTNIDFSNDRISSTYIKVTLSFDTHLLS